MEFIEIPAGRYVVGAGDTVKRHAVDPELTWDSYPLVMREQHVELVEPIRITRDLVTRNQARRHLKRATSHDDEVLVVDAIQADAIARAMGGRLPQWWEWEIAVRGPEPFLYPWGNDFDREKITLEEIKYSTDTESVMGHYTPEYAYCVDSFGEYATATSVFGLRDLVRVGCEWNTNGDKHVLRSFCDVGAMAYMVPGIRPNTWGDDRTKTLAPRAFSGPIAACYGVMQPPYASKPLFTGAAFRILMGAR